ncbi:helix-turn-helix transcriptional regulator [Ideonella sp. BN130291]|uniref:helix-turn-helix transcriptional regulator n=1 Tax=Ideonella sp. BN130291 TaxID=3112940 RepID=UPI002E25B7E0|nr:YafY family protein [Ideonella sp. BN130291]
MARSGRLLELMQALRRHRQPVSGADLAAELGISLRTLYRDIATLQSHGAHIDGAPGLGYVLRPGFTLPPLMFTSEEIEALVLGTRWVADRGDAHLAAAAQDALAKIAAVLPGELRHDLEGSSLLVGPGARIGPDGEAMSALRRAIRGERKMAIGYRDKGGQCSERTVWPFALGFFDRCQVLVAWCELRQSVRHFRTDRIERVQPLDERYPQRRQALLKRWQAEQGIPAR